MVSVNMKKLESLPSSKKLPVMQSWASIRFTNLGKLFHTSSEYTTKYGSVYFLSQCTVNAFVCTCEHIAQCSSLLRSFKGLHCLITAWFHSKCNFLLYF